MKRCCLLLLLIGLNLPAAVSARLYEGRLMGIDEEPATLVELGEVEKPKICSSAGALLADDAQAPEAEETDVPAPSGPMF